jgi:hypothetical protein
VKIGLAVLVVTTIIKVKAKDSPELGVGNVKIIFICMSAGTVA